MSADGPTARSRFVPPPYPYDRVAALGAVAVEYFGKGPGDAGKRGSGGPVDCSVGTPCDPPPPEVVTVLGSSGAERGYPTASGSRLLREAAVRWMARRFGVTLDPDLEVAACVGTKELVASTPHFLRLREPERDTVLVPAVAYPTYEMGALLAGCRTVVVPEAPGGGLDLGGVSEADAARALLLWVNSPANPTGSLSDLDGIARWGRERGIPVFSDECYVEFTWNGPGRTVLSAGVDGVVAVHSLSKRSNLAGLRAGFFAGDPSIVQYLADVRRHGGLMVPGPVQAAVAVALDDDVHVEVQRSLYRERLELLAAALRGAGFPATMPDGGFYLWVPVDPDPAGGGGGWHAARELVETAGILTSPGELYGADGAGHVRIAVVQPTERLELVAQRLARR